MPPVVVIPSSWKESSHHYPEGDDADGDPKDGTNYFRHELDHTENDECPDDPGHQLGHHPAQPLTHPMKDLFHEMSQRPQNP